MIKKRDKVNSINDQLLDSFIQWEKASDFLRVAKEFNLSRPYVCSVSKEYVNAKNKIMIIGQETKDFSRYDCDWPEESIQHWGIAYLEFQLWQIEDQNYKIEHNGSAFWKMFRQIESEIGLCPCWNNVDKAHRIIEGKTVPLNYEAEKRLNGKYLSDGKSILQEEICITDPDIILFITGPYYAHSMAIALQIEESILSPHRPSMKEPIHDITEYAKLNKKVLWTYHPSFLNRQEKKYGMFSNVLSELKTWCP